MYFIRRVRKDNLRMKKIEYYMKKFRNGIYYITVVKNYLNET